MVSAEKETDEWFKICNHSTRSSTFPLVTVNKSNLTGKTAFIGRIQFHFDDKIFLEIDHATTWTSQRLHRNHVCRSLQKKIMPPLGPLKDCTGTIILCTRRGR
ncbi:hypothetical protein AB3S75_016593 [Citrus x aurantiifolia]